MKTILVVDNDPITLHILAGMLKSHTHFLTVFTADSIENAIEILNQEAIDLIITGLHIPEPDVFQLLLLLSGFPDFCVVVITNNASEIFHTKIKMLPFVVHFDQMLDIRLLVRRIFTELQIDYGGQVQGLTLSSLLQVLESESRSCTLLIAAKSKLGTIHLVGGKPVAAKAGDLTGKAAVLKILNWQNVLIDIDYKPREIPVEIDTSLMRLLLESGQLMDETLSQRQNLRQHRRYDCLVGVEYLLNDVKYQCYMRDLGEGGAYLETDQEVTLGQQIVLTLYSPALEESCAIHGTIVRRDKKGIGVQFDSLGTNQKQVIQTLIESCSLTISTVTA
jgi:CheY-like chemotaxis protein/Tfp pilus assembly protein PilZ